jgi:transcriptional regulator with XRE-family HTH domain
MRADRIVAARLKAARLKAGISQERLGVAAGIDEMTASARMNQYERAVHLPKPDIVARIAEVLKIPASYFYEPDDEVAEAILLFASLNKGGRKKAISSLRSLAPDN